MNRTSWLPIALLLIGAAACARGDGEADRSPERPADQPDVAITEEDPHAGHDMPAASDTTDEHADHGVAAGATTAVADPHAEHAAAPARPATAAADEHAGHTAATVPRAGTAAVRDDHAEHAAAATPRAAAERGQVNEAADTTLAHDQLMELARSLVADPLVQRRIRADSALRALWADSSVRRHILSTEPQEQR